MTEIECRHHWLIEAPAGDTSRGRCKLCGDERDFSNISAWERRSKAMHGKKLTRAEAIDFHRGILVGASARNPNSDLYVE